MQIDEMEICSCHNKVSSEKRVRHNGGPDRALGLLNSLKYFNKMSDEPHPNEFIYAEIDSDISYYGVVEYGPAGHICPSDHEPWMP